MRKSSPVRTDGEFGQLYAEHDGDVRRVVRSYRMLHWLSYRQAWEHWFTWAAQEAE